MSTKTATRSSGSTKKSDAKDALSLLSRDHKDVKALFKQFDKLADSDDASDADLEALAREICAMLTVHATIEEEIFYPAARDALDDDDLLDEAEVEHGSAKELIAQIESGGASEPLFAARVKVLGEYIDHHVKEEEGELFPKLKKTDLDLEDLGQTLMARKEALMPEVAG